MTSVLSFAQQRLWFLDQLLPGNTAYHISWTVRLRGPLDRDALTWSLDRLLTRHEVLRTSIDVTTFREPLQLVHQAATMDVRYEDLSGREPGAFDEFLDYLGRAHSETAQLNP